MPVVRVPCCGCFQCRQKLVSYNYHHSRPNVPQRSPDQGRFAIFSLYIISSKGSQTLKIKLKKKKKKDKTVNIIIVIVVVVNIIIYNATSGLH